MKKFIYGFIFLFSLFIGINGVEAKLVNTCYYKDPTGTIDFKVTVDDIGSYKAILLKDYTVDSGNWFSKSETQKAGATWTVKYWGNKTACYDYLKYEVNFGDNKISASETEPTLGSYEYALKNYDLSSSDTGMASAKCSYDMDTAIGNSNVTISFQYDPKSLQLFGNLNIGVSGAYQGFPMEQGLNLDVSSFTSINGTSLSCPSNIYAILKDSNKLIVYSDKYRNDDSKALVHEYFSDPSGEGVYWFKGVLNNGSSKVDDDIIPEDGGNIISCQLVGRIGDDDKTVTLRINSKDKTFSAGTVRSSGIDYVFDTSNDKLKDYDQCPTDVYAKCTTSSATRTCNILTDDPGGSIVSGVYHLTTFKYEPNEDASYDVITGKKYSSLECKLSPFMKYKGIDGYGLVDFSHCEGNYIGTSDEWEYHTNKALRELATYCNELYSNYKKYKNDSNFENRAQECDNFDEFYNKLVSNGEINSLSSDCGFMTSAVRNKIVWILNIVKIAGPVLAIALSALDFVKVIASGEADKEMKTAGKKVLYRFVAAILLFIIPILLAWLMDVILDKQNNDPFCNVVDWSSIE